MKSLSIFIFILTIGLASSDYALAQDNAAPPKWGVEADLLVPFVPTAHIITIRASRTIVGHGTSKPGDLLLGVYLRPNVKHDVVEEIDEYLITFGYRQYLWKGFHIEAQTDWGYAWGTRNKIDGKDYNNFALLVEGHTGYRFHLSASKSKGLYLNPQVGIIHGLITDIGPRGGNSDTFLSAKINIGFKF